MTESESPADRPPAPAEPLLDRVMAATAHRYAIEGEIGRGGMSVVYRARDLVLDRTVAIKVLPPELAYDPVTRARFTREAQTSALLAHPHIVPIHDVGERDGIAYFVMAHVAGGNLGTLLDREGRLASDEVRRLLREIADALSYAHVRGVIHRDIKPDNILLDADSGRAMVTDFGIARAVEAGSRLTVTGIAVGTPTYMSPEQAVGERELDGRADIYSLGVIGYQMLTGRVPFTSANTMALLLKHVNERPRPISDLRPDVPRGLRDAVERALMKAPEDRWPNAAALRDALVSEDSPAAWRAERRDPVRYPSPRPESARRERTGREGSAVVTAPTPSNRLSGPTATKTKGKELRTSLVLEPLTYASLSPEERHDLRIWAGRVNLLDRVKGFRRYSFFWVVAAISGMAALAGVDDVPPLVLGPLVPLVMSIRLWQRGRSLQQSGLKLRRVLLMPRARWAFPPPPPLTDVEQVESLAPPEVMRSPEGQAIRRAAEDRAAILATLAALPPADATLLPDLAPTVNALVDRVVDLAQAIHRLDQSIDPRLSTELDSRIASVGAETSSPEGERRLALLQRQRATLADLVERRAELARQLDNAGLMLGNLRLDLIKVRSSGMQAAIGDVSSATQEARVLSREIANVLAAASEVRKL